MGKGLLRPEVAFGGLDGAVSEQQLDLLQIGEVRLHTIRNICWQELAACPECAKPDAREPAIIG